MKYRMRNTIHFIIILLALLLGAAIFVIDSGKSNNIEDVASEIEHNLFGEIEVIKENQDRFRSDSSFYSMRYTTYRVLLDSIIDISDNRFFPDIRLVTDVVSPQLIQLPRGDFLVIKKILQDSSRLLTLLPLIERHKSNSRYLVSGWNSNLLKHQGILIESLGYPGGATICIEPDRCLFKVITNGAITTTQRGELLILGWLAYVLFCLGFFLWIKRTLAKKEYVVGFFIVLVGAIFLRGAMLLMGFPRNYVTTPYFDPQVFAASDFNPSIGDLLLNSLVLLVVIYYLFISYYRIRFTKRLLQLPLIWKRILPGVLMFFSFLGLLLPYLYIQTIFHNSNISLDITRSIHFDGIRVVTLLSLFIGCISAFLFIHVTYRLAKSLCNSRIYFFIYIAGGFILFSGYFILEGWSYWLPAAIGLVFFIVLYFFKTPSDVFTFTSKTFIYFLTVVLFLALLTALSISFFREEEKRLAQFRFGNNFLSERDVLAEYMLEEAMQRIVSDPFIQARLASPFLSKASVRQKIRRIHLNAYFGRYEHQVYLFTGSGEPLDNPSSEDLSTFLKRYQGEALGTDLPGLYLVSKDAPLASRHYLLILPLTRFDNPAGYVVLDLKMKRSQPNNVFPELLVDNRFAHYYKDKDFSYAVVSTNQIKESFGDFNYENDFEKRLFNNDELYSNGIKSSGFIHVGIKMDDDRIAIVSSPGFSNFSFFTNFSFYFLAGLVVIAVFIFIYGIRKLFLGETFSYSARIRTFVFAAFSIPLLVASGLSLNLTSQSARDQQTDDYLIRSRSLAFELSTVLNEFIAGGSSISLTDFENRLVEMSRLGSVDASVFGLNGRLIASSQPMIFTNQLVSDWMDREAWRKLVIENESYLIQSETIGSLKYNATYVPLLSPSGVAIGYLSIPFFESAQTLEKSQITVFSNILNIFSVLFILFSVGSIYALEWLTFPLQFITKRLRVTTLGGMNKPLIWRSDDEIGLMVKEYNKMVANLEKSKIELERSQKESAWREIAQQVAHEIKNPITPMKLTLQQMELDVVKGNLDSSRLKQSMSLLLRQIEILNEIASSFSTFAKMPAPILEKVDLGNVLQRVASLHKHDSIGEIDCMVPGESVLILADEKMLSRIFSNIILNALQSGNEGDGLRVVVKLTVENGIAQVVISDNGRGIEKGLWDKVFLPKFSTKETGSGIGLSLARQGIDQIGGKIWFESAEGIGTQFIIELPLLKGRGD